MKKLFLIALIVLIGAANAYADCDSGCEQEARSCTDSCNSVLKSCGPITIPLCNNFITTCLKECQSSFAVCNNRCTLKNQQPPEQQPEQQ